MLHKNSLFLALCLLPTASLMHGAAPEEETVQLLERCQPQVMVIPMPIKPTKKLSPDESKLLDEILKIQRELNESNKTIRYLTSQVSQYKAQASKPKANASTMTDTKQD